jgi:6-phosphogluconolactonase
VHASGGQVIPLKMRVDHSPASRYHDKGTMQTEGKYAVSLTGREIMIVPDAEVLSARAAHLLVTQIEGTVQAGTRPTVALTGGSTPKRLYHLLAHDDAVRRRIPWNEVHFFWGDERHVPPEHGDSNYRMAREAFLSAVPGCAQNIHRIHAENTDAAAAATEYERQLRTLFGLEEGQFPRFTCVLLGMGADGHTASLFPGTAALGEQRRLVVANWVEQLQTYRITLTAPVLNSAELVIFLVSGREKAEALRAVLEGAWQPERFPAQLIRPAEGRLVWIVDHAAASRLTCEG